MKLERQVAVRHLVGSSADRRRDARFTAQLTAQRVLVCSVLFMLGTLVTSRQDPPTTNDLTKLLVKRYAFEAFPQWSMDHQERACPDSIDELSPFVPRSHALDDWGTSLELRCGNGYRGAYVRSAGADGRFETADDITSND